MFLVSIMLYCLQKLPFLHDLGEIIDRQIQSYLLFIYLIF